MREKIILVMSLAALLAAACVKKPGPKPGGEVLQETSTVKFWGYKLTVPVNATLEQLDDHLTKPESLKMDVGKIARIEQVSGVKKLTKPGDHCDYEIKTAGFTIPYRLTMIRYEPNQEIWYMTETMKDFLVTILRYELKPARNGTHLTVKFEMEEPRTAFTKSVDQAMNLHAAMVSGTEEGTAWIQQIFDPSVTVAGLLEGGERGENYVGFFTENRMSIYIDAPAGKVHEYLSSPETWAEWEKNYKVRNLGPCLTGQQPEGCQAVISILGVDYKLDFSVSLYEPGKFTSSYFTSPVVGIGRIQTFLNPRDKGTDLVIDYMVQLSQSNPAGTEFLVNLTQLPGTVERMLKETKANLEPKVSRATP